MSMATKKQRKLIEEDKNKEDSGDDTSGSEEIDIKFLFRSALDVGSTFIKIIPEDQDLIFYFTDHGTMEAKVYCENMTPKAPIAFLGWTSNQKEFEIEPKYGFIRPGEYQYVTFTMHSQNYKEVDKGLFFIKALPLADNYDIDELEDSLDEVFNENNQRILFTISTLSGGYNLDERGQYFNEIELVLFILLSILFLISLKLLLICRPIKNIAEHVNYNYHVERDNLIYSKEYLQKTKGER